MSITRRGFLGSAAAASLAAGLNAQDKHKRRQDTSPSRACRPSVRSSSAPTMDSPILNDAFAVPEERWRHARCCHCAWSRARRTIRSKTALGSAALPNEEGVVELDACCMHGPTRRAGSVGGVRNIKNVSLVAKAVMEHTGHVMLVGEGAERFAVAMGFPAREPAHRALAQDLAAVEGISLHRRLVGTRPGLPAVESAGHCAALRTLGTTAFTAWKSAPLRSASSPNSAWRRSAACSFRRPARSTVPR